HSDDDNRQQMAEPKPRIAHPLPLERRADPNSQQSQNDEANVRHVQRHDSVRQIAVAHPEYSAGIGKRRVSVLSSMIPEQTIYSPENGRGSSSLYPPRC